MFTFLSCAFVFIAFFSLIVRNEQQFLLIIGRRVPNASIVEVSFAIMICFSILLTFTIWYPRISIALALISIQDQL
jgi:hypothetical protein